MVQALCFSFLFISNLGSGRLVSFKLGILHLIIYSHFSNYFIFHWKLIPKGFYLLCKFPIKIILKKIRDPTSGNFFLKLLNPRLDFFLLVVSQIFLKIKKLERNSKIIDRRLEREEREQIYRKEGKRSLTCRTSVWSKARSGRTFSLSLSLHSLSFSQSIIDFMDYNLFSQEYFSFQTLISNF